MKYIITTDNKEQGWLDAFNSYCKSNYKMEQTIEEQEVPEIKIKIDEFNNAVACGPAIELNEA
ncbi:hypothetical protein [Enterococcus caccae]|uniref:Uncharacterized protein n=1 Tax=Enterococcus caccae ATCC BAA-1240 TaxID=1158612 RepID=R3WVF9_9ENTE|nr:hypothetical protein [Enterococcus caccae]EOL45790.1 hypothetical protein UC7_01587 [Enterococcus caccae ATCC BAA-1240]EOT60986.1 hypothetical protein I580_01888 [Enterococcus caccae ATCC BAA-1240]OJG27980.1 hypothetical protein RU98_GL002189 [Enterococcus caccae]